MRQYELSASKLRKFKCLEEIVEFLKKKKSKKTCYSFVWGGYNYVYFKNHLYVQNKLELS